MWKKSIKSSNNGSCVEVDLTSKPGFVLVRDSKLGSASPVLRYTRDEWVAFLDGANKGEFNLAEVDESAEVAVA